MAGNIAGGEIRAEPNLTPLLDVVFQLITFFMLVINFNSANYDQRVRLPVAGSAKPIEGSKAAEDWLVLNIDAKGRLLWQGKELDAEQAIQEINLQAQQARYRHKLKQGDKLPTTVEIRADRSLDFSQFYRLLTACQANGFTKFSIKAMNQES